MNFKLIPLKKDLLEENQIFLSPATLLKWHCEKKYSDIFVKQGGRLLLNVTKFHEKFMNQSNQ